MVNRSAKIRVFFVSISSSEQQNLKDRLLRDGILPEFFCTPESCRKMLDPRCCDLLAVDLSRAFDDGLRLFADLRFQAFRMPKLALVGDGDVATTVKAMKAGADDCVEKPFSFEKLLVKIRTLLPDVQQRRPSPSPSLTKMEATVLKLILEGKNAPEKAAILHRSIRTVEGHRRHIMVKLGVSNAVELFRVAASMGWFDQIDSS